MDAAEKYEEMLPIDHTFCGWVKQITDRTKLSFTARQRIENLLRSLVADHSRTGFRSSRFHSPV